MPHVMKNEHGGPENANDTGLSGNEGTNKTANVVCDRNVASR